MTDETRQSPAETVSHEIMGTAATEAIRIAETYLPRASQKRQKLLAMEIVDAINLCEAELSGEIVRGLEQLNTFQRPEGER
jgi:hypothetical protein